MSDLPILELLSLAFSEAWSMLQWWASISFGLIALTHFAGNKLNLVLVTALSVLYCLFTLYSMLNYFFLLSSVLSYGRELTALREAGSLSDAGIGIMAWLQEYGILTNIVVICCVCGTFIGTLSFLIYTYRKERNLRRSALSE